MTTNNTIILEEVNKQITNLLNTNNCHIEIIKTKQGANIVALVNNDNDRDWIFAQSINVSCKV